jgi:hypothetical protein
MVKPRLDDPLTADQLRAVLDYDPATGVFTWKWRENFPEWLNIRRAGKVACSEVSNGYVRIDINTRHYLAHRLAWLYVHGHWPTQQIDHINEDRSDNRIVNLREASHSQNNVRSKGMSNSSSGVVGIYRTKNGERWVAHVGHGQGKLYLGTFATIAEAKIARDKAARRLHGAFARTE